MDGEAGEVDEKKPCCSSSANGVDELPESSGCAFRLQCQLGAPWDTWFKELCDPSTPTDFLDDISSEDTLPEDERVKNCINSLPSTSACRYGVTPAMEYRVQTLQCPKCKVSLQLSDVAEHMFFIHRSQKLLFADDLETLLPSTSTQSDPPKPTPVRRRGGGGGRSRKRRRTTTAPSQKTQKSITPTYTSMRTGDCRLVLKVNRTPEEPNDADSSPSGSLAADLAPPPPPPPHQPQPPPPVFVMSREDDSGAIHPAVVDSIRPDSAESSSRCPPPSEPGDDAQQPQAPPIRQALLIRQAPLEEPSVKAHLMARLNQLRTQQNNEQSDASHVEKPVASSQTTPPSTTTLSPSPTKRRCYKLDLRKQTLRPPVPTSRPVAAAQLAPTTASITITPTPQFAATILEPRPTTSSPFAARITVVPLDRSPMASASLPQFKAPAPRRPTILMRRANIVVKPSPTTNLLPTTSATPVLSRLLNHRPVVVTHTMPSLPSNQQLVAMPRLESEVVAVSCTPVPTSTSAICSMCVRKPGRQVFASHRRVADAITVVCDRIITEENRCRGVNQSNTCLKSDHSRSEYQEIVANEKMTGILINDTSSFRWLQISNAYGYQEAQDKDPAFDNEMVVQRNNKFKSDIHPVVGIQRRLSTVLTLTSFNFFL